MSTTMIDRVIFTTAKEFNNMPWDTVAGADAIVVDNYIYKNRFGRDDIPYTGDFGRCRHCKQPVKIRDSFLEKFVGCMC